MMRWWWYILLGAASLLHGSPARAADLPVLAPTKDVVVTYKLTGAARQNGAPKMQVTYASQGRVRLDFFRYVEAKVPVASLIFDPPANVVTTVLLEKHGYLRRDVGTLVSPAAPLNDKMGFKRQGAATVAGLPCTDWDVSNGTAAQGTACVTDDGVVLRMTRTKPDGVMEALGVQYGAVPAGTFTPPADFTLLNPKPTGGPPQPVRRAPPAPGPATSEASPASPKPEPAPAPAPGPSAGPVAQEATPRPAPAPSVDAVPGAGQAAPTTAPAAPAAAALPPGWTVVGEPPKQ
jgi:hypothetical protein